jgi:hypothetical protein
MADFRGLDELFGGRHFDREVIVLCVSWYLRFKLGAEGPTAYKRTIANCTQWITFFALSSARHRRCGLHGAPGIAQRSALN